mgnify:CR=1 FL=1
MAFFGTPGGAFSGFHARGEASLNKAREIFARKNFCLEITFHKLIGGKVFSSLPPIRFI